MDIAEIMKALADTNRLRILNLLGDQTLCVCDLEEILALNQSNLSRHLAKLRQAGLVSVQKRGLFAYYARRTLDAPYENVVAELYSAMLANREWVADQRALAARLALDPTSLRVR